MLCESQNSARFWRQSIALILVSVFVMTVLALGFLAFALGFFSFVKAGTLDVWLIIKIIIRSFGPVIFLSSAFLFLGIYVRIGFWLRFIGPPLKIPLPA